MRRLPRAIGLLLFLLAGPAAPGARAASVFDWQVSPGIDLFFTARARAATATRPGSGPAMQKAIAEVSRLEQELGGSASWGLIEGALAGCRSATDIRHSFEGFPEQYTWGGTAIPLRASTVRLAKSLQGAEAEFLKATWPKHLALIEKQRKSLEQTLAPAEPRLLPDLLTHLDYARPDPSLPVYLVGEAPEPWGFTRLDRGSQPMIVIGVANVDGTTLAELPVHELIHACDAEQGKDRGAPHELRQLLADQGIAAGSAANSQVVHALMYIESGEAVRRAIDPKHIPFGQSYGIYGRMPDVVPLLTEWWERYLDGSIDRSAALKGFTTSYAASRTVAK